MFLTLQVLAFIIMLTIQQRASLVEFYFEDLSIENTLKKYKQRNPQGYIPSPLEINNVIELFLANGSVLNKKECKSTNCHNHNIQNEYGESTVTKSKVVSISFFLRCKGILLKKIFNTIISFNAYKSFRF